MAQKSRNPNNTEADFAEYKNDKIMAEVLKRLKRDDLKSDEQKIADYLEQVENSMQVALVLQNREVEQANKKAIAAINRAEKRADKAEEKADKAEEKLQAREQKLQAEQEKLQAEQEKLLKAVNAFLGLGKDIPYIADILNISIEEAQALFNTIKAKNM